MLTDTAVVGSISSKTNVGMIVIQFALFNQLIRLSELLSGPEVLKLNPERQIHPACQLYMSDPNLRSARPPKTDSTMLYCRKSA